MNSYKSIIYKLLFLVTLIIGYNYLYKFFFYEKDIQTYSDIINLVRKVVNDKSEIIYLGESSNTTFRADDIDKRPISDFISDYFPSKKFGSVTKEASHAGIYYELLKNIPANAAVKTIIVTLNLRSFDASWIYSDLETPLQKSIVLLKDHPPLFNRFLLSFKGYDVKTKEERERQFKNKWKNDIIHIPGSFKYDNVIDWDKGMAVQGIRNPDGSINHPLTELACHYIKAYAFQIDTLTNPRIKDFDKIVALAKERNWHLVFNLMAENIEMADSLVGKQLVLLIKQNSELLLKRYNKHNVYVVNNMDSIHNETFVDQNWTTEHYAENGRKIIAKNVAECLKKIYPTDYITVSSKSTKPSEFFNDCESDIPWGQMQTLTTERSFSGKKSSKTGQGQQYGLTFEYPINNLPDSLTQISIDFQLFQHNMNNDVKLAVEISGKNIEYQWTGTLIKDLSKTIDKWERINYVFKLPDNFYKGDLIKIYVDNPGNSITYIDDINIKFSK